MKNYGLLKFKDVDVNNFTSDIGMDIRKAINPVLRRILRVAVKGDVIVERYPKLEKNKPYKITPSAIFFPLTASFWDFKLRCLVTRLNIAINIALPARYGIIPIDKNS